MPLSSAPRVFIFALAGVLLTAQGFAQPTQAQAQLAQSLFDQGRALVTAGRYDEACPKFAASQKIDPGGGTLMNLALCHEAQGRTATAYTEFHESLSLAIKEGRKDREQFARTRIAALEPRLARLTIDVDRASAAAGILVTLDGIAIDGVAFGTPMAVDPGAHHVEARLSGNAPFASDVAIGPGEVRAVSVVLAALAPLAPPAPVPSALAAEKTEAPEEAPKRENPVFWAMGALAIGALGTSVVTGLMAQSNHSDVEKKCVAQRGYCFDPTGAASASDATTFAWVSTFAFLAGVGATVGLVLVPRYRTTFVKAAVAPNGDGAVFVGGRF